MTTAAWMREFVTKHPDYKKDSIVSDTIAYDLMVECNEIGLGRKAPKRLLGDAKFGEIKKENAYNIQLGDLKLTGEGVSMLVQRYAERAERAMRRQKLLKDIKEKETELDELLKQLHDLDE